MLSNIFLNSERLLLVELSTMINPKQHTDCCTTAFMQIIVHHALGQLMLLCILLLRYAIQNSLTPVILLVPGPLNPPSITPKVIVFVVRLTL